MGTVSVGETYVCLSFWGSQSKSSSPQTATTASTFTAGQSHGFQASFRPSENEAEWGDLHTWEPLQVEGQLGVHRAPPEKEREYLIVELTVTPASPNTGSQTYDS